LIRRF